MEQIEKLKTTLAKPVLPINLPTTAQWLAGEGAGSWFFFEFNANQCIISRFSADGKLECTGSFVCQQTDFDHSKSFDITYLSHCQQVTIIQDGQKKIFLRKTDFLG